MLTTNVRRLFVLVCIAALAAFAADQTKTESITATVQGGTATFIANTNVPAVSVKGKSTALEATVNLRRSAEGLQLEHIEAHLPVKMLSTGMGVRDDHMRKYIFTTADGQLPDLRFEGSNASCSAPAHEAACPVTGMLTIRGIARPFTVPLKIKEEGGGFKASGEAVVKLSTYGIEKPSQFGVTTTDEVRLHFDFGAKVRSGDVSLAGGGK